MGAPETLFCNIVEAQYNAITGTIDTVIRIPILALRILKSNLMRVKLVLYVALEAAVDVLISKLNALFDLIGVNGNESGLSFCEVAFNCQAVMDTLFAVGSSWLPFMSEAEKTQAQTDYKSFEFYICKKGLQDLVISWIDGSVTAIENELDILEEKLLGISGIDALVAAYMEKLQEPLINGKNIFELLDTMDQFAKCAFSVCNYVNTSSNKRTDYYDKLQITKTGSSYAYVVGEAEEAILEQDEVIRAKMNKLRSDINLWRAERVANRGTKPDEVMK